MRSAVREMSTTVSEALKIIDNSREIVDDHTRLHPLETEFNSLAYGLRSLDAGSLYLLYADDNEAGTFKWRGAFNKAAALKEQGVTRIVVPSAGNHARGAVLAARQYNLQATIIVPTTAPRAKKEGLKDLWPGGNLQILPIGVDFNESLAYALDHPELGELFHPFDDLDVIAGQGTLADDLERMAPEPLDHIVLPVGGGGLLAGLAWRLLELGNTHTQLHAIQPQGSTSLSRSLKADKPVTVEHPNARYGGSAVRKIGYETFRIIRENRDRIHTHVVEEALVDAVMSSYQVDRNDLWRKNTPAIEPTTLVAAAGLISVVRLHPRQSIAMVDTGHNAPLI